MNPINISSAIERGRSLIHENVIFKIELNSSNQVAARRKQKKKRNKKIMEQETLCGPSFIEKDVLAGLKSTEDQFDL